MYIIPCSDDCIYQKDGYCILEEPSKVNNINLKHCIHYIKHNPGKCFCDDNDNSNSSHKKF